MYGGTLEFAYRDDGKLYAANETLGMEIDEPFDFLDYQLATDTQPFPKKFQALVQNAISFYLSKQYSKYNNVPDDYYFSLDDIAFWFFDVGFYACIIELIASFLNPIATMKAFKSFLFPHQVQALDFLSTRPRSLLAAATGLGKTAVSLAFMSHREFKNVLLVVPPALSLNWCSEIKAMLQQGSYALHVIKKKSDMESILVPHPVFSDDNSSLTNIYVLCYTSLTAAVNHMLLPKNRICWDLFLFDEAHALKCHTSQRSKAAFTLTNKLQPKNVLLLSATPSPFTKDWWNILRFLDPNLFADFFHYIPPTSAARRASSETFYFAERYIQLYAVPTKQNVMRWCFNQSARLNELHALTRPYILTQKKDLLKLPPLLREYIVVGQATPEQRQMFHAKMHHALLNPENQKKHKQQQQTDFKVVFGEMVRETCANKLPSVQQFILSTLESLPQDRFIVWAYHKPMMEGICNFLRSKNIVYMCINGDTPKKQREHLLTIFEKNVKVRVGVMSLMTCGTGLNMTFVNQSIYAELTTHHVAQVQSEGRCHRIGQKAKNVVAQYLIYKDSTDEILWKSMLRKSNVESIVLTNKKADFEYETEDLFTQSMLFLKEQQHTMTKRATVVHPRKPPQKRPPSVKTEEEIQHMMQCKSATKKQCIDF